MIGSALYDGAVVHQRFAPARHRLRYRLIQLLVDVDELPTLDRTLRLFAHNRPALLSLYDQDHGAGDGRPLRDYVEATLRDAGLEIGYERIELLTLPRVFGYAFNPLSVFYCRRPGGGLGAVILEVTNTFGERHSYVIEVPTGAGEVVRVASAKTFFVSPFLPMEMTYEFRLGAPGERIATNIKVGDEAGRLVLAAAFSGRRVALTDRALAAALVRHPLVTFKVIAAIHFEALKLALRRVGVVRKPAPPYKPITVVPSEPRASTRRAA